MPLFNNAEHLPEAIESILLQTERAFAVVMVDDLSTDETETVACRYAAIDGRIRYERNERRLGMIENWRRAFERARELYPESEYFAWVSDHDIWHPRWLAALLRELDADPEVVAAYPMRERIEPGRKSKPAWRFATPPAAGPASRLAATVRGMAAGDMVYALFRAPALERAGVFKPVLLPDRLLLAELAVLGHMRQIPERLWYRRVTGKPSLERQRLAFFPDGAPRYSRLPWVVQHVAAFTWAFVVRGSGRPKISRWRGALLALHHFQLSLRFDLRRRYQRRRNRVLRRTQRLVAAIAIRKRINKMLVAIARAAGRAPVPMESPRSPE